jgi:putative component of membrane protein insertase Oxa1/YidC/SpoIIIJ protein YidD
MRTRFLLLLLLAGALATTSVRATESRQMALVCDLIAEDDLVSAHRMAARFGFADDPSLGESFALAESGADAVLEVFRTTEDPARYRLAAAALRELSCRDKAFATAHPELALLLPLAPVPTSPEAKARAHTIAGRLSPPPRRSLAARAAGGFIGFYRFAISPALGARCALHPSCSSYFLQAARKHGVLAVPITADRFVREPVSSHSDEWVTLPDGRERHPDPLPDHDFWFSGAAK